MSAAAESADHRELRAAVAQVASRFGDDYWLARDHDQVFPAEFHAAMAAGGWFGIAMPQEHGGAAMGVTEACVMMHEVSSYGLTSRHAAAEG